MTVNKKSPAKKKSLESLAPKSSLVLPPGFMEELASKLSSKTSTHQKTPNGESSDMAGSEMETESERDSNSDSSTDSESESEQESELECEFESEYESATEVEPISSSTGRIKQRAKAAVKNVQKQSIFTGVTTVVLIGNPGVGKSTLLNVLGGDFESGFSMVDGLTQDVTTADVKLQGRRLRLVDMPGINETDQETTVANLKCLQDELSNEGSYVLFFVVAPRNGRIGPNDFGLIRLVLKNLRRGPTVGMILTQVPEHQIMKIRDPKYASAVFQQLKEGKAKTTHLEQENMLILPLMRTFNREEKQKISNYVLSFEPKQVKIRQLAIDMFEKFKAIFIKFQKKATLKKKKQPTEKKKKQPTEKRGPQAI